jgi:hypothetical protein
VHHIDDGTRILVGGVLERGDGGVVSVLADRLERHPHRAMGALADRLHTDELANLHRRILRALDLSKDLQDLHGTCTIRQSTTSTTSPG